MEFPGEVVSNFKTSLGSDNNLSQNETAYMDKTRAQTQSLWLPMSKSVLITDGNVTSDDLAKTDAVLIYNPLVAAAVLTMPEEYDLIKDGLDALETRVLQHSDSRLFSNASFAASKFSPNNWPLQNQSVQAALSMGKAIEIIKAPDGKHVVNFDEKTLDAILDGLGVYPGKDVYSNGQTYLTPEDRNLRYGPLITSPENIHREMLKHFTYFARADGEGILLRSFMENSPEDFGLLYRRSGFTNGVNFTSLGFQNTTFMTPMELSDGTLESFMTTVYKIVGDAKTPRAAAERLFDYQRKNWRHYTGGGHDFANLYRQHFPQNPYTPPAGYVTLVREGNSQTVMGFDTAAFRLLGIKAEHFTSPREGARTIAFEIGGRMFYTDGNSVFDSRLKSAPMCSFFNTLEQIEDYVASTDVDRMGDISILTNCS